MIILIDEEQGGTYKWVGWAMTYSRPSDIFWAKTVQGTQLPAISITIETTLQAEKEALVASLSVRTQHSFVRLGVFPKVTDAVNDRFIFHV